MTSGLAITRLGVQATASDDLVHGLLCLRISLPKENDLNHAMRWNIFSGSNHPKLISEPSIHSIPLPLSLSSSTVSRTSSPRALAIASTLLSLPTPSSYPPIRNEGGPYLHTGAGGQVSVVLDPLKAPRRRSSPSQAKGGRSDWVVILEFEEGVVEGNDRHFSKVMLSLPKCLHSVIRFQINPPTSGPSNTSGEVSITTEPKMLALPASTFTSPPLVFPRRNELGYEEGWEDGEDLRSELSEDDDEIGNWLEGRFQATNQLRLEWSFLSSSYPTTLRIEPRWDNGQCEIGFHYETTFSSENQLVPIEFSIPEGWAWKQFDINGPHLRSFQSTDVKGWYTTIHHEEVEVDDSFSTIRKSAPQRPGIRSMGSSSLLKQSLPDVRIDEFSFEVNHDDSLETIAPTHPSPGLMSSTRSTSDRKSIVPDHPTPARLFDLIFTDDDDDDDGDKSFVVEGILVPLPHVLVCGHLPVEIPYIELGECQISCPNSTLPEGEMCNTTTSSSSIGQFTWVDAYGQTISPSVEGVKGDINVRLNRDEWGITRMNVIFPYPRKGSEVGITLKTPRVNISKAEIDGQSIRRCMTSVPGGYEIQLKSDTIGMVELGLDLGTSESISLPHFRNAEGTIRVELRGTGWNAIPAPKIPGLTSPQPPRIWTIPLPAPLSTYDPLPLTTPTRQPKSPRTLFSFSTFFNILLLYLVISLGQQVQRLRSEISFVADETRDLRMYSSSASASQNRGQLAPLLEGDTILPDGIDFKELLERLRVEQTTGTGAELVKMDNKSHSLGRVVFGQSHWTRELANHPAIRTVSIGVSKIWDVVIWLLHG